MTPEELVPGYELRPAWRLEDPLVEADAIAFWTRLDFLPSGVAPEEPRTGPAAPKRAALPRVSLPAIGAKG